MKQEQIDTYGELLLLSTEQQREILIEVIDMKDNDRWRYVDKYKCIQEVIDTSRSMYFPKKK